MLVHGVGVSSRYFVPTAACLAARWTVLAPDLPGFGHSAPLRERPTVRRLADALEAWLDAAGIGSADVLVAHSFGCQIVVDLLARRPQRASAAIFVGPTVDRRRRSFLQQSARLALDAVREPLELSGLVTADYVRHIARSGFAAFVEMLRDRVEDKLPFVDVPVIVARGARDAIVRRDWAEEFTAGLPQARLVEIPGTAHAANYTAPLALARLTLALLHETAAPLSVQSRAASSVRTPSG